MNKAFSRVNWRNLPNRSTPLSDTNLNRSDSALDIIDNRVINLDTTKADKTTLNGLVSDVSYNSNTGVFTIRRFDGTTKTYDTDIEKVAVNFDYDADNKQIILYDATGHVVDRIDLSDFININEFVDSDSIAFEVNGTNVSAVVKNGSITEDKLQPNYLSSIMLQAGLANSSANDAVEAALSAKLDALLAKSYAVGDTNERPNEDVDNAKYYKEQAEKFATSDYAIAAESYAKGGTNSRPGEDTDNAKYYKEQAELQTITSISATVDANVGTPSVDVKTISPAPNKSFRFDFHNIKGEQGEKGDTGIAIVDSYITDNNHLILVYEDESEVDAGVIGTNIRQLTMAEYEALPDDVKMDDGLYFWITDADGGTMTIIVSGVTDYMEVTNKPKINGVELVGDKTLEDLGIEGNIKEISFEDFDALPDSEKNNEDIYWWIKGWSGGGGGGGSANLTVVTKTYTAPFKSNGNIKDSYETCVGEEWFSIEFTETNYPGGLLIPVCIQPLAYLNTDKTGENVGYRLVARALQIKGGSINLLISLNYPNCSKELVTDDNGNDLYFQYIPHYFFGAIVTFLVVPV